MYKIRLYKDAKGNQPIKEYLNELATKTDKDSRVKLGKRNMKDFLERSK